MHGPRVAQLACATHMREDVMASVFRAAPQRTRQFHNSVDGLCPG